MSERLPYETALATKWSSGSMAADFPLPDENLAWADMRRRLDEDEERRPIAWWRWGCLGWALLGVLAVGAGWYFLQPQKWFRRNDKTDQAITIQKTNTNNNYQQERGQQPTTDTSNGEKNTNNQPVKATEELIEKGKLNIENGTPKPLPVTPPVIREKKKNVIQTVDGKKQKKIKSQPQQPITPIVKKPYRENNKEQKKPNQPDSRPTNSKGNTSDSVLKVQPSQPVMKQDTTLLKRTDTIARQKPLPKKDSAMVKKEEEKKEEKEKDKTPFVFSAGLGLHQQIPLAGQTFTPYSAQGRKASLADYLPSVYLRFEKEKKWFLQGEFRYGAPQYTKQFTYRQRLVPDTGSNPQYSTLTSYGLKKTFYHQLPLTFHYFIRPGWSIGAGMQWNLFKSAVAEREINRKNNFTQTDSIVSRSIFREDTAGTVFRKTYWQAVIETQYKLKRFSFGARYAFGLQPYIQFALPGQPQQQERNNALQLFIRYELWRQKK
ncbi:MAG TPA: hypothetical protein PLO99_00305 [Chitinophagaceae bacterium]|jgi:hypothetical protein|nr:hypothetical protein [Chitinophagaceae bacterium]HRG91331.1 hypothetical protein [Chitinophagaceae bacterium]